MHYHPSHYISAAILLLGILMLGACSAKENNWLNSKGNELEKLDTIPMMIQQVQQCSRLYTAEYKVHKIITHSDTARLSGTIMGQRMSLTLPGGRRKVAIPMDATLKAYIDFADFSAENVERNGGKIRITLPKPHVVMTSSSIDHEGVKKYVSIIRSNFTDEELSSYEKQGRESIIKDIPALGILQAARRSAATQLIPIISMLGIDEKNIEIVFNEETEEKGGITWIMD